MKLLILLVLVAVSNARVIEDGTEKENDVIINGINFKKQILRDNVYMPYQLAVDYETNALYFSYSASNDGSNDFISALINLKTKEFGIIFDVTGAIGNAIDPKNHKIYIGGSDGIYVLNQYSQMAVKTNITNLRVWQVFVQDDVYFTTYPKENAYVHKNGRTERVPEIGDARATLLAVDKNYNFYYYNSSGFFYYNKAEGTTEVPGDYKVNGFVHDVKDNNILFSTQTGIYLIKNKSVTKIVDVENTNGAVIATDGSIIYAADNSIVRLKSPKNCDGLIVNGINHEMQILKEDIFSPYQLALDYETNTLYFSYTDTESSNDFKSALINLKTSEFGIVNGVKRGIGNAVDPKTHKIYIAGKDGIYVLNQNSQTAVKTNITNLNIWQVFVQDDIYFTTYPKEEAYVYKNGETKRVSEIGDARAMFLAVDKNHDIYYRNSSGLFYYNKADGTTTVLGDYSVNGFTFDKDNHIVFSTGTGFYSIKDGTAMQIVNIDNISGGVIAADGSIIYAGRKSIVRLQPTGDECSKESLESFRSSLFKTDI